MMSENFYQYSFVMSPEWMILHYLDYKIKKKKKKLIWSQGYETFFRFSPAWIIEPICREREYITIFL